MGQRELPSLREFMIHVDRDERMGNYLPNSRSIWAQRARAVADSNRPIEPWVVDVLVTSKQLNAVIAAHPKKFLERYRNAVSARLLQMPKLERSAGLRRHNGAVQDEAILDWMRKDPSGLKDVLRSQR
ncbi:MAG: hypothetical protein AAF581_07755 [Planctomycetota bacterium]